MSTNQPPPRPRRHTVQVDHETWQWLVNQRALTGKTHQAIIAGLVAKEKKARILVKEAIIKKLLGDEEAYA